MYILVRDDQKITQVRKLTPELYREAKVKLVTIIHAMTHKQLISGEWRLITKEEN